MSKCEVSGRFFVNAKNEIVFECQTTDLEGYLGKDALGMYKIERISPKKNGDEWEISLVKEE